MASWLLQAAALATYRNPLIHRFMQTRLGSATFVACYDIYKDVLEVPGSRALARQIPPGSWVIDVGANIGFFTERFAQWVGGGGRVIAIEPDADNVELLRRRLARHGRDVVNIHQAAATAQTGTVRLLRNPVHPGDHRIADTGNEVDAVTIDDLVERAGNPEIALIKIDTQGSEPLVLAGAIRTIRRCKPALFIEVDDAALRQYGSSGVEIMRHLQSEQYRLYRLSRGGTESQISADDAIKLLATEKRGYLDLLCVHATRVDILLR